MSASATAITNYTNKQTGPRTSAGKQASSNNATLHGGTSKKLFVPGENPADFDALLNGLLDDYRPDTSQSRLFVENVAIAQWFLWRRQRAHNAIEAAAYESEPDEAKWTEQQLKKLALADRYKTQAERSLKRALNNLDGLQKWTRGETDRETRRAQWAAEQDIRERRMTLAEQKFHLAQTANTAIRFAKNAVSSPESSESNPGLPRGSAENHVDLVGVPAPVSSLLQCQQA